jgi:hypothetical protein
MKNRLAMHSSLTRIRQARVDIHSTCAQYVDGTAEHTQQMASECVGLVLNDSMPRLCFGAWRDASDHTYVDVSRCLTGGSLMHVANLLCTMARGTG